jgi:glucose/arabinose dehydrogenase
MKRLLSCTLLLLWGCSSGGGQTSPGAAPTNTGDIAVPAGYRIDLIADGLTFPTGIAFDEQGTAFVVESGYSYGEVFTTPRVIQIDPNGEKKTLYEGENPPWNGITYGAGKLYIAEGSQLAPGRIIEVDKNNGAVRDVVVGLPSLGDHHTDGPLYSPDGYLYWGQGTATNAGVVGEDNAQFGWLHRFPDFHDTPCEDITLEGHNFESDNPLAERQGERALTGAFLPFGTSSTPGQVIKGQLPCNGAVLRVRVNEVPRTNAPVYSPIELVAWGFRNPYGLAFGPDGGLFITENGFDERGARHIFGAGDILWRVEQGRWYGWPDYSGGRPVDVRRFKPPLRGAERKLLRDRGTELPQPAAFLAVHSSSNGFDFSRSEAFGHVGEAFVAQFGDTAPSVGNVTGPVGFKVVRVDVNTGVSEDFATNHGDKNGPASLLNSGGLERPIAARFSPDGSALYVVDFGVLTTDGSAANPVGNTGRVWRISHE